MIEIIIPGEPIAKKRPKFARRGKFVTTYNDQETEEGKFIAQVLHQLGYHNALTYPLQVEMVFCRSRPKSHYGTGKNSGVLKQSAPKWPDKTPDIDNYEKFVFDCLNEIVWKDDCQVVKSSSQKKYAKNPRTEIRIMEAQDDF